MQKEIKLDIIGFICLLIGIGYSLFIDMLYWVGIGLVIVALGIFLYANHLGSVRFRNEIRKIDRESNARLITELIKICKEANKKTKSANADSLNST